MRMRRASWYVLALLLAAATAPAASAHAADPWRLRVLPEGALRAEGAAAVVAVRLSCPSEIGWAHVRIDLTQAMGGERVTRTGRRQVLGCSPTARRYLVPVPAADLHSDHSAPRALSEGSATVVAQASACGDDEGGCPGTSGRGRVDLTDRDDMDRSRPTSPTGYRVNLWANAGLSADGSLLRARHSYSCDDPHDAPAFEVELSQAAGGTFAMTGWPSRHPPVICDGQKRITRNRLSAMPEHAAFQPGPAFEMVHITSCGGVGRCYFDVAWREVLLKPT